jgi:hypothetical protein
MIATAADVLMITARAAGAVTQASLIVIAENPFGSPRVENGH